jgi:uncharacterized protein (DUF433 family)
MKTLARDHILEVDDVRACLAYAHAVLADDSLDAVQLAK